jgi:hypothetical protein
VTKIILTNSVSHKGTRIINGNKECKTAAEIRAVPRIKTMVELIEEQNWEKISMAWEQLFHHKTQSPTKEKKEAAARICAQ